MEQKFKCKDEIIYRCDNSEQWKYGIFSHYNKKDNLILIVGGAILDNWQILPYEENKHLVGTTDSPEEEIELNKGDLIVCSDLIDDMKSCNGHICRYRCTNDITDVIGVTFTNNRRCNYKYCIPLSKFNPNDLEATKKEILKVKNGKLVKVYK